MNELDVFNSIADQMNNLLIMGAWLELLPMGIKFVGDMLGGASKGRSEGRAKEIDITQARDAAALDRARLAEQQAARQQGDRYEEVGIDLDRREYTDKSRSQGYDDRLQGGLLQGLRDAQVTAPEGITMGSISGGLRPSALIGKEALGRDMARSAIQRGLEGPNFSPIERIATPSIPGLSELPKASKLDTFLNIANIVGNLAGGASEIAGAAGGGGGSTASTPNAASETARRTFRGARF